MEKMTGLIHIYCGEGKGKTTAALGLIVRASGAGYDVVIVQYFKSWDTSELRTLENFPNVTIVRGELPHAFTWELTDKSQHGIIEVHNEMFRKAVASVKPDKPTLLVMDEMIGATSYSYIDSDMVLDYLKNKPDNVEVIMTGRNPLPEFVDIADYVSDIHKIKHPFDRGILARKGIEY
ncbi:MAG: cob(I)yrinic acid a,c-diamide adenosyltransferase [Eubacteriales bacterium]|jgi:cob(I)alamin adenosyltransferase|nr:cob(I)yrinic acid a,c-diamide adenosyltransferase [Eubacteriales bacterium]MDD4718102.1 cob(I)yrinic acid a,c-diamide adenosyltransferase [Eubacteriales bacterium]